MATTTQSVVTASKPTLKVAAPVKAAPRKAAVKKVTAPKPAAKKPAPQTVKAVKAAKVAKVKKPKLVRDSFTMPKDEYAAIDALKQRAIKLGQVAKKSELLRAGIKALTGLSDIQFKAALSNVPTIKTGRPTNAK
jgi:hypothetical protein